MLFDEQIALKDFFWVNIHKKGIQKQHTFLITLIRVLWVPKAPVKRGGTADAEIRSPSAENPKLNPTFNLFMPGRGQSMALHALVRLPPEILAVILIFAFSVH